MLRRTAAGNLGTAAPIKLAWRTRQVAWNAEKLSLDFRPILPAELANHPSVRAALARPERSAGFSVPSATTSNGLHHQASARPIRIACNWPASRARPRVVLPHRRRLAFGDASGSRSPQRSPAPQRGPALHPQQVRQTGLLRPRPHSTASHRRNPPSQSPRPQSQPLSTAHAQTPTTCGLAGLVFLLLPGSAGSAIGRPGRARRGA
jgi:hypothetical protein